MSDPRERDHWRELADLLGLPPDENQSAPAASPTGPPPRVRDKWDREPMEKDWTVPEAEPVTEDSFEPKGEEEGEATDTQVQAASMSQAAESEDTSPQPAAREAGRLEPAAPVPGMVDESSHDRPRRGRRSGRRGERDRGFERDDRASRERTSRALESGEPSEQPLDADQADAARGEASEEEGGGWAGHERRQHGESDAVPDAVEEEILDADDADRPEPPPEEEDDEEIDKLTDWNVPSWTELIGSLYRPDR